MNILLFVILGLSQSEAMASQTVVLYQVGSDGNYCVSTNNDESGCISGVDEAGNTINIMDMFRGKTVVFENLSDAPHDMKFTGQNKDHLDAQYPGDSAVEKTLDKRDMENQKINCSFHGDQLAVGYRVPDRGGEEAAPDKGVHNEKMKAKKGVVSRPIQRTSLADVSDQVLRKGNAEELEKLLEARPELMAGLKAIRPETAKELLAKGIDLGNVSAGEVNGSSTLANPALVALSQLSDAELKAKGFSEQALKELAALREGIAKRSSIKSLADLAKAKNLTVAGVDIKLRQKGGPADRAKGLVGEGAFESEFGTGIGKTPRQVTEKDFVGGKIVRTQLGHRPKTGAKRLLASVTGQNEAQRRPAGFSVESISRRWEAFKGLLAERASWKWMGLLVGLLVGLGAIFFFIIFRRRKRKEKPKGENSSEENSGEHKDAA